jgi:type II secretory pathway component HofQ
VQILVKDTILSPRGQVQVDERTNMVIITDWKADIQRSDGSDCHARCSAGTVEIEGAHRPDEP